MKKRMLLCFLLPAFSLGAQDFLLKGTVDAVMNQSVEGYTVLHSASGDLNRDAYPDWVLIYRKATEAETSDVIDHPEPRPLLLNVGQPDGSLQLAARNDKVVLCYDCGGVFGDPFSQVVIKNGFFTVEHYGGSNWRWTRLITFRYQPKARKWYLHKDGGDSYHTGDPDKVETVVKTTKDFGTVPFETFDCYAEN